MIIICPKCKSEKVNKVYLTVDSPTSSIKSIFGGLIMYFVPPQPKLKINIFEDNMKCSNCGHTWKEY